MRLVIPSLLLVACGSASPPASLPTAPPPATQPAQVEPPRVDPSDPPAPLDPQIRTGKLPNGLTWYVMKHKKPEQRAALWLAVNAGSVQEDDDQQGLAHFIEHMAFNGSKRFPKQAIIDYSEKVGMRLGPDTNAYTSFDETVYQLTVPTDPAVLATGFDILRDIAGDVSFEPDAVEKERSIVLEEWRLGRGGFARILDKQWPVIFLGSRYAERIPIGKPEIIKTASRDTLVRYYKDWYQPQNMAVIAVGDFDEAAIEKEIATRFGDLKSADKPRARKPVPVPHDQPPAVSIATDREMPFTSVTIYHKLDHRRGETKGDFRQWLAEQLYHTMLSSRFQELAQDAKSPILGARSGTGALTRTLDAFTLGAAAKEGRVEEAVALLFREVARVARHGFLPDELERARHQMLSSAETQAAEWDKASPREICAEMTRNFFSREQMPGRVWELAATKELLPTITLDELAHLAAAWSGEKGMVVTIGAPESAKLPTGDALLAAGAKATSGPIDPWVDTAGQKPLMAAAPAPGKVVKTSHDAATDATVWTLANGVRVVVKPTQFQNDEVLFGGWQRGGSSLVADKDWGQARLAASMVAAMGAGELDPVALSKALAGKVIRVNVNLGELTESLNGEARPADLETALQLVHLRLATPRRDEAAFAAWKDGQREFVRHRLARPESRFFDELTAIMSSNHPRHQPLTEEIVDKVDLDKALAIYRARFADLGGFTFVFVGNLDLDKLQPLVETYLGSLPGKGRKETWKDLGVKFPKGKVEKSVAAGTEPKSLVALRMEAPEAWTIDGDRDAEILSMALDIRLREVLRADMGGVYNVSVFAGFQREPRSVHFFEVTFGCDPANVDKLKAAVFAELDRIGKSGVDDAILKKVSEQLRRQYETDVKTNRWWLGQLREAWYYGGDFKKNTDIEAEIARVTNARIQAAARHFFDPRSYVFVALVPEAGPASSPAPPPAPM